MTAEQTVFDMDNQYVTDPQQRRAAAAALARIVELDWPEGRKGQLPTLLLRALCDLTASPESQGDEGWEPLAIAQEMRNLGARWPALTEEDARLRINNHWKTLERLWSDRSESVGVRLSSDGFDLEPRLEKLQGGGAGNRTRYHLRFYPVPASSRLGSDTQADEFDEQQSLSVVSSPFHDIRVGERAAAPIRYYAVPMQMSVFKNKKPVQRLMTSRMAIEPLVNIMSVIFYFFIWAVVAVIFAAGAFLLPPQYSVFHDDVLIKILAALIAIPGPCSLSRPPPSGRDRHQIG